MNRTAMNANTLKYTASLCFILAAGSVFGLIWEAICLAPVCGQQQGQMGYSLLIGLLFSLLFGLLGWGFWRKAKARREDSLLKINRPLKGAGLILLGIIGLLLPHGLILTVMLAVYFWQTRVANKRPPAEPPAAAADLSERAAKGSKLGQCGWWCVVLALVLLVLALLAAKCLFPNNGEAVGMFFLGFGILPAILLGAAAGGLAFLSLIRREPARWSSLLLSVLTLSPLGWVFYETSPEPKHTITVYRANHGDLKAMQSLANYYYLGGLGQSANPQAEAYWMEQGARAGIAGMALEWACLHDGLLDDPHLNAPGSRGGFSVNFLGRINRNLRDAMQIQADDQVALEFYQRAMRPESNAVNAESKMDEIVKSAKSALEFMANRYVRLAQASEQRFATNGHADELRQAESCYKMAVKADSANPKAQTGLKRLAAKNQSSNQPAGHSN